MEVLAQLVASRALSVGLALGWQRHTAVALLRGTLFVVATIIVGLALNRKLTTAFLVARPMARTAVFRLAALSVSWNTASSVRNPQTVHVAAVVLVRVTLVLTHKVRGTLGVELTALLEDPRRRDARVGALITDVVLLRAALLVRCARQRFRLAPVIATLDRAVGKTRGAAVGAA